MIKQIDVRFFSYCINDDNEADLCEISESQFLELQGVITYARHSVFNNGVKQICLTIDPIVYPIQCESEETILFNKVKSLRHQVELLIKKQQELLAAPL